MYWRPLSKGSKNPPLDTQILLKGYDGTIGIGIMRKDGTKIYFDFQSFSPVRAWYGADKKSFTAWTKIEG